MTSTRVASLRRGFNLRVEGAPQGAVRTAGGVCSVILKFPNAAEIKKHRLLSYSVGLLVAGTLAAQGSNATMKCLPFTETCQARVLPRAN